MSLLMIGKNTVNKMKNNMENNMISESHMKALKRQRKITFYIEEDEEGNYERIADLSNFILPEGPHAPNKNESKALRQICSKTGLTADEVREIALYKQKLVIASKVPAEKRDSKWKFYRKYRNNLLNSLEKKIHPESKEFKKLFIQQWESDKRNSFSSFWAYAVDGHTAYFYSFNHH